MYGETDGCSCVHYIMRKSDRGASVQNRRIPDVTWPHTIIGMSTTNEIEMQVVGDGKPRSTGGRVGRQRCVEGLGGVTIKSEIRRKIVRCAGKELERSLCQHQKILQHHN